MKKMNGEKEVTLVPVDDRAVTMFERLATDPNVDVDKLERLIQMQERIMHLNAKAAFNAAFSQMQPKIPVIDEHGRVEVKGNLRSMYAPLEDIHDVIKPITAEHGFAIRHRTEWPADKPGIIRIVGILSHEQGHSEESAFEAPMDHSDYRSDIQSMGSTVSYGRRYTTLDLLNIATRKIDNDGAGKPAEPPTPPDGFANWWAGLADRVPEGLTAYHAAWKASKEEYRNYAVEHFRALHEERKVKAAQADAARKTAGAA